MNSAQKLKSSIPTLIRMVCCRLGLPGHIGQLVLHLGRVMSPDLASDELFIGYEMLIKH